MPGLLNGVNGGDNPEEQDPDIARDINRSGLVPLNNDEFPLHFVQRNGRLFPSHGSSPYPLPVDGPEQNRLSLQHEVLRDLIRADFSGPVRAVLEGNPGSPKHVVDFCTGTGLWVLDMAGIFPSVRFDGSDIVPIATRHPPHNVVFQIQDVTQRHSYRRQTIDVVHARCAALSVRDYSELLKEAARILKPDGLFLSGEFGLLFSAHTPTVNSSLQCPGAARFFVELERNLFNLRGISFAVPQIRTFIEATRRFRDVQVQTYDVPVGGWPTTDVERLIGNRMADVVIGFAYGMRELFRDAGWGDTDWDMLYRAMEHDVRNTVGMFVTYFAAQAHRI